MHRRLTRVLESWRHSCLLAVSRAMRYATDAICHMYVNVLLTVLSNIITTFEHISKTRPDHARTSSSVSHRTRRRNSSETSCAFGRSVGVSIQHLNIRLQSAVSFTFVRGLLGIMYLDSMRFCSPLECPSSSQGTLPDNT